MEGFISIEGIDIQKGNFAFLALVDHMNDAFEGFLRAERNCLVDENTSLTALRSAIEEWGYQLEIQYRCEKGGERSAIVKEVETDLQKTVDSLIKGKSGKKITKKSFLMDAMTRKKEKLDNSEVVKKFFEKYSNFSTYENRDGRIVSNKTAKGMMHSIYAICSKNASHSIRNSDAGFNEAYYLLEAVHGIMECYYDVPKFNEEIIPFGQFFSISCENKKKLGLNERDKIFLKVSHDNKTCDFVYLSERKTREDEILKRLWDNDTKKFNLLRQREEVMINKKEYIVYGFSSKPCLLSRYTKDIDKKETYELIIQLIQLVQEINSTKTVIRTLNPDNVYVCKKDGVDKLYIASLKEAKDLLGNSTETRMEYIQETYGGDAFIAPEVKVGKNQFEKSDVYSVGKIMEYMLKDSNAFPMVNTLITRMIEIDVNKRIDLSKVKSEMEKIISPTLIVFDKTGIIDKREIQTRVTFGRNKENNDVCIPSKIVSRSHGVISEEDGKWIYEDVCTSENANGSFVNGGKIISQKMELDRSTIISIDGTIKNSTDPALILVLFNKYQEKIIPLKKDEYIMADSSSGEKIGIIRKRNGQIVIEQIGNTKIIIYGGKDKSGIPMIEVIRIGEDILVVLQSEMYLYSLGTVVIA